MKHSRLLAGVGLGALLLGIAPLSDVSSAAPISPGTTASAAKNAAATAVKHLNRADLAWLPSSTSGERMVRVIVEVAGSSVASAKGDAIEAGVPFSDADAAKVKAAAEAAQATVTTAIDASGGTVEQGYTTVINALSVSMPAAKVISIANRGDVVNVTPVRTYTRDNGVSNAFTGVPSAWADYGATGLGQKVAIIDTGVDYTHADFGGSGNPDDFTNNDSTIIEPGTFPTAKVVAGYDFVGDTYDAASTDPAALVPHPDPDPLDCALSLGGGHGTHTSGTATGDGVLLDGSTFHGPYDDTINPADFLVSPGSAPEASLMIYRVFGCSGSVDNTVLLAAMERAVDDGADVISMSLGGAFGKVTDPDSVAADNAAKAGAVVVVAAGNEGQSAYMVGGPSTGHRVISVAALDAGQTFPGATISDGTTSIGAINANNIPTTGITGTLVVIGDGAGGIGLGCDAADYPPVSTPTIYVALRGTCDRVDRAKFSDAAGAVAAVLVNSSSGLTPFEGPIPGVDIPFLGVDGDDAATILALNGSTVTLNDELIANPGYTFPASFSSGGPRSGDSGQKPDLIAPGVSVASAYVGSGTQALFESGTSMATPHVAGIAALVRQTHPWYTSNQVKSALVGTANPAAVGGFDTTVAGNGLVNPVAAIATKAVLQVPQGEASVNFGYEELTGAYTEVKQVTLKNLSSTEAQVFDLSVAWNSPTLGATVQVSPKTVSVPAGQKRIFTVTIKLSAAAAAALPVSDQGSGVISLHGQIVATPRSGMPTLRMPFLSVPHARSDVAVTKAKFSTKQGITNGTLTLKNGNFFGGIADVYNWLLTDPKGDESTGVDSRAVGVQYFADVDAEGNPDNLMVFAFSDFDRFSNPGEQYTDSYFDTDGDGILDHEVLVVDSGLLEANDPNGIVGTYTFDLATGAGISRGAFAPTDGSVELGFVYASDLGLTTASAPAAMVSTTVSLSDNSFDDFSGIATVNPFDPQASSGDYDYVGAHDTFPLLVAARKASAAEVPVLGWMVVTMDDASGKAQSDLVKL